MATVRQKLLAGEIIKNVKTGGKKNKGQLVESVGYSSASALKKAGEILESPGVIEELEKLGFTTEGADAVVKNILFKGKREENKLKAADMVYKRLGAYEDTKQGAGKTLVLVVSGETAQRYGNLPNRQSEESSTGPAQV